MAFFVDVNLGCKKIGKSENLSGFFGLNVARN
jgi:hypothetical protein